MIITSGATQKLQLVTSAAATIDVEVAGVDFTAPSTFVPYSQQTAITTATTTDILAVRGASVYGNTEFISISNKHASTSCDVELLKVGASITVRIGKVVTLSAGEWMIVNEAGTVFVFGIDGGVRMGAITASDTVPGLIEVAVQAEMEAATSTVVAVTPGRLKFHPGVAKVSLHTTGTATPVADSACTYGCTITDTGVGQLTVNFTTAFSAAGSYQVQVNVEVISTTLTAAANVMQGYMRFGGQASASSCQVNCCDRTATTNVIRDPISWHVAVFGDLA